MGWVVLFWDGEGLCVVGPFVHESPARQWVRAVGAEVGNAAVVRCMDPTDWDI